MTQLLHFIAETRTGYEHKQNGDSGFNLTSGHGKGISDTLSTCSFTASPGLLLSNAEQNTASALTHHGGVLCFSGLQISVNIGLNSGTYF